MCILFKLLDSLRIAIIRQNIWLNQIFFVFLQPIINKVSDNTKN